MKAGECQKGKQKKVIESLPFLIMLSLVVYLLFLVVGVEKKSNLGRASRDIFDAISCDTSN